jgi:DNA-binding response OmpR family regulator
MKTILIIEDDLSTRSVLETALKKSGYAVLTARNGHEGVEMFNVHQPDLVVLDIMMPKKSGVHVIRDLEDSKGAIIVLSAVSQEEFKKTYSAKRVAAWLEKPVKIDILREEVKRLIG